MENITEMLAPSRVFWQLLDAPCIAPSTVTQMIFAALVERYHHIVLTMSFKLISFLADRTNGRAYATVLRLSVRLSSVCL